MTNVDRRAAWRYTMRRVPWRAQIVVAVIGTTAVGVIGTRTAVPLPFVHATLVALAAVAALTIDDSALALTLSLPAARAAQRRRACALAGGVVAAGAVVAVGVAERSAPQQRLPIGSLTLEIIALTVTGWAVGCVLADRHHNRAGGRAAALTTGGAAIATTAAPTTADVLWSAGGRTAPVTWAVIAAAAMTCAWWTSSERRVPFAT